MTRTATDTHALVEDIGTRDFSFVPAARMHRLLGPAAVGDWPAFADSWNRLELDTYAGDGGAQAPPCECRTDAPRLEPPARPRIQPSERRIARHCADRVDHRQRDFGALALSDVPGYARAPAHVSPSVQIEARAGAITPAQAHIATGSTSGHAGRPTQRRQQSASTALRRLDSHPDRTWRRGLVDDQAHCTA
jgi:hypothetical protein